MAFRGLAIAALPVLLAACATQVAHVDPALADRTRVDYTLVQQPAQPQYAMDELTLFVMPMELESPSPAFPPDVAPGDVAPVTVCVEAWLDAEGDITRVVPARGEGCPHGDEASLSAYEQASMQALRAWSFSAAAICRFPEALRAQRERGDCRGSGIELEHVPVRLTYAFTFERHAGRAQVATAKR
jgi:hypothetical protein